jgi:hypothetical protein
MDRDFLYFPKLLEKGDQVKKSCRIFSVFRFHGAISEYRSGFFDAGCTLTIENFWVMQWCAFFFRILSQPPKNMCVYVCFYGWTCAGIFFKEKHCCERSNAGYTKTKPIFGQRKKADLNEKYQFFSQNSIDNLWVFVYNANCSFYMS